MSFLIALGIVTYLSVVLGELVPKALTLAPPGCDDCSPASRSIRAPLRRRRGPDVGEAVVDLGRRSPSRPAGASWSRRVRRARRPKAARRRNCRGVVAFVQPRGQSLGRRPCDAAHTLQANAHIA